MSDIGDISSIPIPNLASSQLMSKAKPTPRGNALTDGQKAELIAEFKALQRQQRESMARAIYVGMSASDAQEYDRRARRITELQLALGINLFEGQ